MDDVADRHHGHLIAIDPSVRSPGVAVFKHGKLAGATAIKITDDVHAITDPASRWIKVAEHIGAWIKGFEPLRVTTVTYELPQWYGREKSKGDPNQLAGLVGVGQSVLVLLCCYNVASGMRPPGAYSPKPAEWTGQMPKATRGNPWNSPRGQLVWRALDAVERLLIPQKHDAIDAVGLGLHALRRFGSGRVLAGAV